MCVCVCVCSCARSVTQLCLTLCDSLDYSPPGSFVHGIFQAWILEQVAISSSSHLPGPGIKPASPVSPTLAGGFFTTEPPWKPRIGRIMGSQRCPHPNTKHDHIIYEYVTLHSNALDYTGWPNLHTWTLKRKIENPSWQWSEKEMWLQKQSETCQFKDRGEGLQAKECGQPVEHGRGKNKKQTKKKSQILPKSLQEGMLPTNTLTLGISDLCNCRKGNLYCFKPLTLYCYVFMAAVANY